MRIPRTIGGLLKTNHQRGYRAPTEGRRRSPPAEIRREANKIDRLRANEATRLAARGEDSASNKLAGKRNSSSSGYNRW